MSHLIAKKLPDGKLKIFNKNTGKTEGKEMADTPASKDKIKAIDKKEDKKFTATKNANGKWMVKPK